MGEQWGSVHDRDDADSVSVGGDSQLPAGFRSASARSVFYRNQTRTLVGLPPSEVFSVALDGEPEPAASVMR